MIDRRRFLKALGLGSVAAILGVFSWAEPKRLSSARAGRNSAKPGLPGAAAPGAAAPTTIAAASSVRLFRGDGGAILVSLDDGATWSRHGNLGSDYRVNGIRTSRKGEVRADVGYAGRRFKLELTADGLAWRTA